MRTVKIGTNPIGWTNDDMPELGGDTPLETCLTETKLAGFAGTELGGKFPKDPGILGPMLDGFGLQLIAGWYDGRILEKEVEAEFEAILPHIRLLKALGATHVVYADTSRGRHGAIFDPISKRPRLTHEEWRPYGAKITAFAEKLADFGVRMAFHHHMGTIIETDDEVDQLMSHTGEAVGLLYDTGHCAFSGGDPATLLATHVKRVVHVHCKDVRPEVLKRARAMDMSFMDAVIAGIFTVPGDGSLDYPGLLQRLADHGYTGWLVVEAEQDPAKAPPLTYARMGYRNLKKLAEDAGFRVETGV